MVILFYTEIMFVYYQIYEEWFGRSVIKSCCKLAYEHAQGFIELPDKEWSVEELPSISEPFSMEEIRERTLNLHKASMQIDFIGKGKRIRSYNY